ncbi:MAG: redoxin domain-containing protein [Verrucomicrobiales bacterium]|nr:redoxin domain-containing protein [Verrucomicrobiales bacterium]
MREYLFRRNTVIMCQIFKDLSPYTLSMKLPTTSFLLALGLLALPLAAQEPKKGIEGKEAPPLGVTTWIQLPEGKERLGLPDFKDEVLVILCFQSTCMACEKREFPVLQELIKQFEGTEGVSFLAIQTPFEDFATNSELQLKPIAQKHKLDIPIGHLAKTQDTYSINVAYETGGTPWWIVIDREGTVVFNDYTMAPDVAAANINKLIEGAPVE